MFPSIFISIHVAFIIACLIAIAASILIHHTGLKCYTRKINTVQSSVQLFYLCFLSLSLRRSRSPPFLLTNGNWIAFYDYYWDLCNLSSHFVCVSQLVELSVFQLTYLTPVTQTNAGEQKMIQRNDFCRLALGSPGPASDVSCAANESFGFSRRRRNQYAESVHPKKQLLAWLSD